jgi:tetratricopeptide (TPR) repeat protein
MHLSSQETLQLLRALFAQGKYREVRVLCHDVLRNTPTQTDALDLLAGALLQSGEYAEALPVLARCIALEPGLPRHHHRRGECLLAAGNAAAAQTHFETALQLSPTHPDSRVRLASCLLVQGYVEHALRHCREALDADPDSFAAQLLCAHCLHQLGLPEAAATHLERCTQLDPAHVPARQELARVLLQLGRSEDAVRHYEIALLCDTSNLVLMRTLAETLLVLGRYVEASHYLERLLVLDPGDATLRLLRGQALERQERTAEALAFYMDAARTESCARDAFYLMMLALRKLGRHDEALRCCHQVLQQGDDYRDARLHEAQLLALTGAAAVEESRTRLATAA